MKIFAISDLHLSFGVEKPMDIFGDRWIGHWQSITESWNSLVAPEDVVLIAGDLSWGMRYEEAAEDLQAICAQSGHKVLLRGNHDFWHNSLAKTREYLKDGDYFLQNDAVAIGDYVFAGARGWKQQDDDDTPRDQKVYAREVGRLRLSLEQAARTGKKLIGLMHYPPFALGKQPSAFTELFQQYGAECVVYGHLHGRQIVKADYEGVEIGGVPYYLTSCDYLDFALRRIR